MTSSFTREYGSDKSLLYAISAPVRSPRLDLQRRVGWTTPSLSRWTDEIAGMAAGCDGVN